MNTRQILEAMLAAIGERGWIQGTLYDEVMDADGRIHIGAVCLEGACNLTYENILPAGEWYEDFKLPVARVLIKVIHELFPGRIPGAGQRRSWTFVIDFNDHKDTTREDVLLVLKRAIEECG